MAHDKAKTWKRQLASSDDEGSFGSSVEDTPSEDSELEGEIVISDRRTRQQVQSYGGVAAIAKEEPSFSFRTGAPRPRRSAVIPVPPARKVIASKYWGVYQLSSGEWVARLWTQDTGVLTLGAYRTEEAAARAYDLRARAVFGKGCSLNFKDADFEAPVPLTSLADLSGEPVLPPLIKAPLQPQLADAPVGGSVGYDGNLEYCMICDEGGSLLCCETCPEVYHQHCLPPGPWRSILSFMGEHEDWNCPSCMSGGPGAAVNGWAAAGAASTSSGSSVAQNGAHALAAAAAAAASLAQTEAAAMVPPPVHVPAASWGASQQPYQPTALMAADDGADRGDNGSSAARIKRALEDSEALSAAGAARRSANQGHYQEFAAQLLAGSGGSSGGGGSGGHGQQTPQRVQRQYEQGQQLPAAPNSPALEWSQHAVVGNRQRPTSPLAVAHRTYSPAPPPARGQGSDNSNADFASWVAGEDVGQYGSGTSSFSQQGFQQMPPQPRRAPPERQGYAEYSSYQQDGGLAMPQAPHQVMQHQQQQYHHNLQQQHQQQLAQQQQQMAQQLAQQMAQQAGHPHSSGFGGDGRGGSGFYGTS